MVNNESTLEAEDLMKLAYRIRPIGFGVFEDVFKLISADCKNASSSYIWMWVAAAAYRAGRMSMWADCQKRRARRQTKQG